MPYTFLARKRKRKKEPHNVKQQPALEITSADMLTAFAGTERVCTASSSTRQKCNNRQFLVLNPITLMYLLRLSTPARISVFLTGINSHLLSFTFFEFLPGFPCAEAR